MPRVSPADLDIDAEIARLCDLIAHRPEFSERPDRVNRLADAVAILCTLRLALRTGEVPRLVTAARAFLASVEADGPPRIGEPRHVAEVAVGA